MDKTIKNYIINELEPNIVSVFLLHGYGSLEEQGLFTFDNFVPSESIISKVYKDTDKLLEEEFLKKLNEVFPKGFNTSLNVLKKRMQKFIALSEVKDITPQEVLEAAQQHVGEFSIPYCGKLENFIYKYNENKVFTSRLLARILFNREANTSNILINVSNSESINSILDEL